MRRFQVAIIDDQQASIDHLQSLLIDIEYVQVAATFQDPRQALSYLRRNRVDFIILDVELGTMNGFDFLTALPDRSIPTILYTAHHQFEDRGYDMNLVDVLLKPVSGSRLRGALRRVNKELQRHLPLDDSLDHWFDYIQTKGPARYERRLVWFKNIVYIESIDRKVKIYQVGAAKPLVSNYSFSMVMNMLPGKWFYQCHQSYVFNINFFARYYNHRVFLTYDRKQLPVGDRANYREFDRFLEENGNNS